MIYFEISVLLVTLLLGVIGGISKSSRMNWKRFILEVSLELLFLMAGVPETVEYYAEGQVQHSIQKEIHLHPVERVDFFL